jgi:DnaJ-class molecular chaperone
MPGEVSDVDEVKRAYQILGVPFSSSATSIKQTYHRLAKQWHPDLYESGTPGYLEAKRMMPLINEAYAKIAHAPLRYHIESYPRVSQRRQTEHAQSGNATSGKDTLPLTDRAEFWARFAGGGLLGIVIAAGLVRELPGYARLVELTSIALILLCGFAAARFGDRFWAWVLESLYWLSW